MRQTSGSEEGITYLRGNPQARDTTADAKKIRQEGTKQTQARKNHGLIEIPFPDDHLRSDTNPSGAHQIKTG